MFDISDLSTKTVMEIKAFAKKNGIDIGTATKKVEILDKIKNWEAPAVVEEILVDDPKEKVAIYSEKKLFWNGVGEINRGYNIVTKEESEKWVTHKAVRTATPEEVATYYGKK